MQYISSVYTGCNYVTGLSHHGIIGMKWGVRRFQNEDGTLTDLGKKRYEKNLNKYIGDDGQLNERGQKKYDRLVKKANADYDYAESLMKNDVKGRNSRFASQAVMNANRRQAQAQMIKENPELLKRAMTLGEKFTRTSAKDAIGPTAVAAGMTAASVALLAVGAAPMAFIFFPRVGPYKYADSSKVAAEAQAVQDEKKRLREEERLRKKQEES